MDDINVKTKEKGPYPADSSSSKITVSTPNA